MSSARNAIRVFLGLVWWVTLAPGSGTRSEADTGISRVRARARRRSLSAVSQALFFSGVVLGTWHSRVAVAQFLPR